MLLSADHFPPISTSLSFNWTRGASTANYENVTLSADADLVAAFSSQFEKLWGDSKRFQAVQ